MTDQPWETHYNGCTRRHPAVAYPRRVCEECRAFERGVQAARDAVAGLEPLLNMSKREGGYDCCGCSSPNDLHDHALAAIDALRGERA